MPRKSVLKPERPEPLQMYGCSVGGQDQLFYWRYAFQRRLSLDSGAPTRIDLFKRISDRLVPGYFEWHDWTERTMDALCNNQWVGVAGAAGCVAGHTRILNPITGEQPTIQELCEGKIPPVVMTLDGPARAEVPFVKGVAELFEIVLENGSRFVATGEHRVCVSTSNANLPQFCRVSDLRIAQHLCAYEPILPPSSWEYVPSIHAQDAPCSPKITANSQDDYPMDFHSCDAQPHWAVNIFQPLFPLQVDARGHIHENQRADDPVCVLKHSRARHAARPSKMGFYRLHNLSDTLAQSHVDQEMPLRAFRSFRRPCLSEPMIAFPLPSSERVQNGVRRHYLRGAEHLSLKMSELISYPSMVSQSRIVSICNTGKGVFYDISVPGPEHYFAEGTIHHNSAKTYNVIGWACTWWLCAPEISSVILCSTSLKSLRKRGWANVQRYHTSIPGPRLGNFVDSQLKWQVEKGNDLHAITGIAVEQGSLWQVADNIKGIHTKRQLVIIDEATSVPAAIFEAATNLYSYPREFIMVVIGNPRSRLDQMGKFCEPLNGWNSVNIESEEWETRPQINGSTGVVIRFDAEKSPNIIEGKLVSKHLPTKEKVEARRKAVAGENDPSYWSNDRGFWPPEGIAKTVFSESLLIRHDAYGQLQFTGLQFSIIGMFDPAFGGGDRPALRFARLGMTTANIVGIQVFDPIIIPLNAKSNNPIHYQLAEAVAQHCDRFMFNGVFMPCHPENLAVDATGEGGGLCDILQRTWSPKIIRIEFGSKASDDVISPEDVRPASEVYRNKRAEMYFRAKNAVASNQLKGIDKETAIELCSLEFDDSKALIVLMSKADYKEKFAKSPDLADSLVGLTEVARLRGFRIAPIGKTVDRFEDWEKEVSHAQAVFQNADYHEEEEPSEDEDYEEALL